MCNICTKKSILMIEKYQKYISPDHSEWWKKYYLNWYCKFSPSCSEYTKISLEKYWFIQWWTKWLYRILRCNPFSKGGTDLP